jgi:hypothetical protein
LASASVEAESAPTFGKGLSQENLVVLGTVAADLHSITRHRSNLQLAELGWLGLLSFIDSNGDSDDQSTSRRGLGGLRFSRSRVTRFGDNLLIFLV